MTEARSNHIDESALMRLVKSIAVEYNFEGTRVELPSVETLRLHHEAVRNRLNEFSLDQIIGFFTPNSISPSTKAFKCLTKVSLGDLSVNEHSEGNYVLLRILEPGIQVIGWLWVIEDDEGNGCILNVYNYPPLELPCVGTVLIVKEPFVRLSALGIPLIRCDCPTDIIVLRRSHKLFHLAEAIRWRNRLGQMSEHEDFVLRQPLDIPAQWWIEYGISLLGRGHYSLAVECYLLALKTSPECPSDMWKTIQSQLCLAYLCLGYYEKTIATAELIADDRLALLSAGRAYYNLRKFQEAKIVFEKITLLNGSDIEGCRLLYNSTERLREQASGFWNIKRLEYFFRMFPLDKLEYGDFIGPVEVVNIPGKGRGVKLTRDVPPETILIISKAFATSENPVKIIHRNFPSEDWLPYYLPVNNMELEAQTAQAIMKNPKTFGPMVYDLWARVVPRKIVQQVFCDSETKDEPICDMATIKAIRNSNVFRIISECNGVKRDLGSGLFIMPSYLNHSCEPNVFITFYNDVMVVRSIGHLKSGVELCISYVDGVSAVERQNEIRRACIFQCLCTFCSNSP